MDCPQIGTGGSHSESWWYGLPCAWCNEPALDHDVEAELGAANEPDDYIYQREAEW